MKQCLKIISNRVILVPYEETHVLKYHEWMKSPELQEATSSVPLTLEEEYQMQKSWRDDSDKYTFIVLDKEIFRTQNEKDSMVGDVNLFLLPKDDTSDHVVGEVTIMIAEKEARGKGLGQEALLLMMSYAVRTLKISKFVALIGENNTPSVKLFEKLKFQEVDKTYFGERKFEKIISESEWEDFTTSRGLLYEEYFYDRKIS
ncbi:N-acetyltransferase 9-like protein [Sergentomyia squamirostris]